MNKKRKLILIFVTMLVFVFNFQFSFAEETITPPTTGETAIVTPTIEATATPTPTATPKVERKIIDPTGKLQLGTKATLEFKQDKPVEVPIIKHNDPVEVVPTMVNTKKKEVIVVMDTSKELVPTPTPGSVPFDYALFAGSEDSDDSLILSAKTITIGGSVHSNSNIDLQIGKNDLIMGENSFLNHCGKLNMTDSTASWPSKESKVIKMPDLEDNFKTTNAARFSNAPSSTGKSLYQDYLEDGEPLLLSTYGVGVACTYSEGEDCWSLAGGTLYLNKNKPYFFEGNLKVGVDKIVGNGVIVATGSIQINNGTPGESQIGFYSVHGGIQFGLPKGTKFTGLTYAPGKPLGNGKLAPEFQGIKPGEIQLRCDGMDYNGSIVGKSLEMGGDKTIKYTKTEVHDDFEIPFTDKEYFSQTKERVAQLIDDLGKKYATSDVKAATILYSDRAEIVNSDFTTIVSSKDKVKSEKDREELKTKILAIEEKESSGCNLGDGLRLAYNLFENKGEANSEKYLIVFSNNIIDKYSVIPETDDFKTNDGDIEVKSDVAKAYTYAENIGSMIAGENYKGVYFVDIKMGNSDVSKLSKIGERAEAKKDGSNYCYNPEAKGKEEGFLTNLEKCISEIEKEILKPDTYITEGESYFASVADTEISYNVSVKFGVDVTDTVTGKTERKYLNKLPEGVEFDSSTELVADENGILNFASDLKVITKKSDDKTKLTAIIPNLKAKIKFVKTGTKKFELAKLEYIFTNIDDGTKKSVVVDVTELSVDVIWDKDVQ